MWSLGQGWVLAGDLGQGLVLVQSPEEAGWALPLPLPVSVSSCASICDIMGCGQESSSLHGELEGG